ncbi:MAG TPA: hypothetical protein VFX97_20695 [Pyrinomonadaceae bacterium]|nr:hypothetical protein [Pyrinomonadaceae bacterium]
MAGRSTYVVAHPDNEQTVTELKGGKVPTFATWAFYPDTNEWKRLGWSYLATLEDAKKKALPDFRKHGMKVTATRVLPTAP